MGLYNTPMDLKILFSHLICFFKHHMHIIYGKYY